jgi:hypothetical protein
MPRRPRRSRSTNAAAIEPINAYNDNPYADLWFEKRLVAKNGWGSAEWQRESEA